MADLLEFLRRAGPDPEEVGLNDPLIEWRGGGPDVWSPSADVLSDAPGMPDTIRRGDHCLLGTAM